MPEVNNNGALWGQTLPEPEPELEKLPADVVDEESGDQFEDLQDEVPGEKLWEKIKAAPGRALSWTASAGRRTLNRTRVAATRSVEAGKRAAEIGREKMVKGGKAAVRAAKKGAEIAAEAPTRASKSEGLHKVGWGLLIALVSLVSAKGAWEIFQARKLAEDEGWADDAGQVRTTEESNQIKASNGQIDLSLYGFVGLPELNSSDHGNNPTIIKLTAQAGGPAGLLDTYVFDASTGELAVDPATGEFIPGISQPVFDSITEQLNLDAAGEAELKEIWQDYLDNPDGFDQNIFLDFLQTHGADPQVVEFYRYSMEVAANDPTPGTWQDRLDELEAWEAKQSSDNGDGKAGLAIPAERHNDGNGESSMEIAANIAKETIHAGSEFIEAIIDPVMKFAEKLVLDRRVPTDDDLQVYLNTAIEAADDLIGQVNHLPREVKDLVIHQLSQWKTERGQSSDSVPADHIYDSPADALHHLTGGGGWPMLIILGIECGLAAINGAKYLKRAKEMRSIPLPSPEFLRNASIDLFLSEPIEQARAKQRGLPKDSLRAGTIVMSNSFGFKGEEVGAEIFMEADLIRKEMPAYLDLVSILRQGVNQVVIDRLVEKKLLITESISGVKLRVPAIRANDLISIYQDLWRSQQLKGGVLRAEVDWYGGERADYKIRQPAVIRVETSSSVPKQRVSVLTSQ